MVVLTSCAILNGEKFMSINFNQNLRGDGAMTDTVAIPDPILSVIKFFLKKKKKSEKIKMSYFSLRAVLT